MDTFDIRALNEQIEQQSAFVTNLQTGMAQTIIGQKHLVESLLIGLLSDGHVLLEGVPGLAKTQAIKTLASLVDAQFSRIQFTPDLLPADVVGTMIYSQKDEKFQTEKGPVFANFVLADEINRAPAKVQSALLEAMQERQVTIGKETYQLPKPFLVLATQNPLEQEGTYPLPEAQVDRFMLKVLIDYPQIEEEKRIVRLNISGQKPEIKPVLKANDILQARSVVHQVYLDERQSACQHQPCTCSTRIRIYQTSWLRDSRGRTRRRARCPATSSGPYLRGRSKQRDNRRDNQSDYQQGRGTLIGSAFMETSDILKRVRQIEIKTKGLSNNIFAGEYHSAFKGRGMAFAEVREYQYGDDIRDIEWNVTARFNKPYVKIFEEERELTVMLCVDVSGSLEFGTSVMTKRSMLTEIAATLAFSAIQNNDKIGVIFFSDRIEKFIPPKKGRKHILYIIRELLQFKPESHRTDIGMAVEYLTSVIKRRCTAFLLSDFIEEKDFSRALTIANRKHDVAAIQVYDRRIAQLPNIGLIKVRDAETGREMLIDTSDSRIRNRQSAWWRSQQAYLQDTFLRSGVDNVSVRTDQDYVAALMRLFRYRT